jgi:hypothetical protein
VTQGHARHARKNFFRDRPEFKAIEAFCESVLHWNIKRLESGAGEDFFIRIIFGKGDESNGI